MQLRYKTGLTSEQYVTRKAWREASLERCPLHPRGGCGFARHTPYARVTPTGIRIARWYCRAGHCTFSLLPDCLAARLSSTLAEVEAVVATVERAKRLWEAMRDGRLVGNQAISAMPYEGATHKDILITLDSTIRVAGLEGAVIVKKMYQGVGIRVETVANDPAANLKIVAVMFKRENGYDSQNRDWFYVKFNPDGTPQKNPKGWSLAGQVPKCRTCHQAAPGGDYVYSYDR